MEWLKKKWELAGFIAAILCFVLRIFGPARLADISGWTAAVFAALVVGGIIAKSNPRLQAFVGRIISVTEPSEPSQGDVPQAFRGLISYREEDAAEYAKLGRQSDIAAILPAIREPGLQAVVLFGETGSGKSSLIHAGLLTELRSQGWKIVSIPPDTRDLSKIVSVAVDESPGRTLFVADQFEEQFIGASPENIDGLAAVIRDSIERKHGKWLIGIRADFLYLLFNLRTQLGETLESEMFKPRGMYGLRLFTTAEAQSVIAEIGKQVLEGGAALQLAHDLSRDGRVLPADVQFVGFEMQQRGIRTLDQYRRAGGRDGIVADSIRTVLEQYLGEDRKRDARRLLLSLIDREHGTRLRDALTGSELGIRAGIQQDVSSFCDPFVKRRLIVKISDQGSPTEPRYRLAHDYLVQPIYSAVGHTETDYEKAVRLMNLYAGQYAADSRARVLRHDYKLIRKISRSYRRDDNFKAAMKAASPILKASRRGFWIQGTALAAVAIGISLFIPPVRTSLESVITRSLNSHLVPSAPGSKFSVTSFSSKQVIGRTARIFQYGRTPFLRDVPFPEFVTCPPAIRMSIEKQSADSIPKCPASIAMGRFDITIAQFNAYAEATDRHEASGDDPDLPVVEVSWSDATNYARWASKITGNTYRLPKLAEWKAFCSVGRTDQHDDAAFGNYAWNLNNSGTGGRHIVGGKKPNDLGVYDMLGNVFQWALDWNEDWQERTAIGGVATDKPTELNCDNRTQSFDGPNASTDIVGFRLVEEVGN